MMFNLKLFIITVLIHLSKQTSSPSSPNYDVGVVEFNYGPRPGLTSAQILEENLNEYLKIMQSAPSNLDIIVFPESTLNSFLTAPEIPEPSEQISPCDDTKYENSFLRNISCSAKQYQRYVVINISTKIKCPDADMIAQGDTRNCSARKDEMSYYNTNVVFDRKGVVVSRYRKFNLFGESVDKPLKASQVTFETDFGVKFGHFVCFDLMFRKPALELIRTDKVTDIIFTTMWFSELPFLTAVQAQQNWAYSNNANFIAAGANFPGVGSTGSGIFSGRKGAIKSAMYGTNSTKLYTATLPKINFPGNENVPIAHDVERFSKEQMKDLKLKRDQLDKYEMKFLEDSNGDHTMEGNVCKDDVCCNYNIQYSITNTQTPHYQYAMAFYHGNRTFDGFADGGVVACSIIACTTKEVADCGIRDEQLENIHVWKKIEMTGNFPNKDGQFFYLPTTLDTSILPYQPDYFEYTSKEKSGSKVEITMKLIKENPENLYTFGIYGRDFNLDGDAAGNIRALPMILISILFAGLLISKFM